MKKYSFIIQAIFVSSAAILIPQFAVAQTIQDSLADIVDILAAVVPVILALAVVYFLWNLAQMILRTDDVEGRKIARTRMFWGIIIIFVMISLWGFVNFLGDSANLDTRTPIADPLF